MIKYCSLLFSLLCLSGGIRAQRTEIYAPHIQTVQVVANNDINAPAVITLDSNDYIELSFVNYHMSITDISTSSPTVMQIGLLPTFRTSIIWMGSTIIR